MMKDIFTVMKKDLKRYFTDFRYISALFFPGIFIFIVYTLIGQIVSDITATEPLKGETFKVAYTSENQSATPALIGNLQLVIKNSENESEFTPIGSQEVDSYKSEVTAEKIDLLIVFSDDFDKNVMANSQQNSLVFYYNSTATNSSFVYSLATSLVETTYANYLTNFANGEYVNPDIADYSNVTDMVLAIVFPLVTMSLLYSSVISICPEAIAGEKERGTFSSLLLTPAKRTSIALGKLLASCITILASSVVSFLGIVFSIPNIINQSDLAFNFFSPAVIIGLFFAILTALLLLVSLGLLVSSLCKTLKEANAYLGSSIFVVLVLALLPGALSLTNIGYAFIPIINVASSMSMLIQGASISTILPFFAVTIIVNALLTGGIIFLIAYLFKKEKLSVTV